MTSIRTRSRDGRRFGLRLATGSAWLLLAFSPISVLAQGFGPDPFRPFNSQYDSYVYPISPGPLDPVGNPGLNRPGVGGPNQFQNYLNGLGSGNVGTRFDQLYRSQISGHRRSFNPSREADMKFEEQQSSLTDLYFKYIREADPTKRAVLLKQYKKARAESTRELSAAGRAASGRRAPKPKRDSAAFQGDEPMAGDEESLEAEAIDEKPERALSPSRRPSRSATTRKRGVPAPPPISGLSGSGSGTRTRDRKPSEVLDRAIRSEGAGPRTAPSSRGSGATPPPPPISP